MNNSEFQRSIIETMLTEKSIAIAHDRLVSGMKLNKVANKYKVEKERVIHDSAEVEDAWQKLQNNGFRSVVLEEDGTFTIGLRKPPY